MQSKESREVAAFLELINKQKYDQAVEKLSNLAQEVGSREHGCVNIGDLEELQLKPSKPFKKVGTPRGQTSQLFRAAVC